MNPSDATLSCSFEEAELNHLRDGLAASAVQCWQWLSAAMDFAVGVARRRAAQGEVTLSTNGEVCWSPLHERLLRTEGRLPRVDEL